MAKKTDYKKMWRKSSAEVVRITNAYLKLKDLTNQFIEVHNKQGELIIKLVDDKITLDEFKRTVIESRKKADKALPTPKNIENVEAPEVENVEAIETKEKDK